MKRAAILSIIALVAASGAFFATTGIARADDCSTPEDCSNTAWTVGGAAAAAAAVVAAAAAAGWLPGGHPEGLPEAEGGGRLSRECFIDLQQLARPVRATVQQIAELTVAMTGAGRMWIDAQTRAAAAQYQAAQLAGGTIPASIATPYTASMSSAIGEAATYGVHRATSSAAEAERVAAGLGRVAETFRGMGETADAARAARQASSYADDARRLGEVATGPGRIATAMGIANIAAELYGQATYNGTEDKLRHAGQLVAQAEAARIETMRWKAFMGNLERRIEAQKAILLGQVQAYNARAAECNAVPLSEDLDAFSRVAQEAAGQHAPATGTQVAPPSILRRAPEPLPGRDPYFTNCDPAFYQQQLELYRRDILNWERRSALWMRWRQRETDLEITANAARLEVNKFEYELAKGLFNMRWLGTISGATAAAAMIPLFSPPAS